MPDHEPLIPAHGGYRALTSFRIARLAYDVTVRFCDVYVGKRTRTHDQMVQAARSGVQNIAEGSMASGTSKKTELKLTNVARASLEELRLDYEDYLRQHRLPLLAPTHPALRRFKTRRCATLEDVQAWVREERGRERRDGAPTSTGGHGRTRIGEDGEPPGAAGPETPTGAPVANAALSLLNIACHLLDRQLAAQSRTFTREGGFSERLFRVRARARGRG